MKGSGGVRARIAVTLSQTTEAGVSVDVTTVDGGAISPADYTSLSTTLSFAPGQTQAFIEIPITGDAQPEPDEAFGVHLSHASNAIIADSEGLVQIVDDDRPAVLTIGDAQVEEGFSLAGIRFATFHVSLHGVSSGPVMVDYATGDGTAKGVFWNGAPPLPELGLNRDYIARQRHAHLCARRDGAGYSRRDRSGWFLRARRDIRADSESCRQRRYRAGRRRGHNRQ